MPALLAFVFGWVGCRSRVAGVDFSILRQALTYAFFLFFQAEDGIRDTSVTGVQTCALPIWNVLSRPTLRRNQFGGAAGGRIIKRSEERRVGKEGRSRGSPYHLKKNKQG